MSFRGVNRWFKAVFLVAALSAESATANGFEIETGIERLSSPQTLIEGLHRLYVGRRVNDRFSFGQGIYGAAMGDAGGAFFWGFEGVLRQPLTDRLSLSFAGFLGGGGGAAQVNGHGTMVRAALGLDYRVSPHWDLQLTASRVRISGAPIDGGAWGLGLRYRFDADRAESRRNPEFDSVAVTASGLRAASGVRLRSGGAQGAFILMGARASFDISPRTSLSFSAAGAAQGAQGYMHIMGAARRNMALRRLVFFAEGSLGLGGGGDVDTGNGLLIGATLGVQAPVTRGLGVELSFGALTAPSGGFRGSAVSLALVRRFDGTQGTEPQRWAFSAGVSAQQTGAGYFVAPPGPSSMVIMQESSIDYFIGRHAYLTGNAQTTMYGGVAGYAIGMVGVGYEFPISRRWSLSFEGHLGAAGGGGVNTAGGIIYGYRAELDYRVRETFSLSLGVGQLATVRSGGMRPMVLTLGTKIPFTTHR